MEPAELWGVIDEAAQEAQEPPAELWGVIAQEPAPPSEQWGVVAIDPAQEAASLWQAFLEQSRHADGSEVLAGILQDDAMLNLDVREEFELCALRYCASAGYDLSLRQALFEQLGWDRDFSYLARSHGDLVRSAVQRYRADRSFAHFSDNRDSYPGLDCIMSQQPPSAYARQLFDQKFTLQLRELLHTIRWQHGEMLAYKLDTDLFEQWEHAVHAKRYFKQTALRLGRPRFRAALHARGRARCGRLQARRHGRLCQPAGLPGAGLFPAGHACLALAGAPVRAPATRCKRRCRNACPCCGSGPACGNWAGSCPTSCWHCCCSCPSAATPCASLPRSACARPALLAYAMNHSRCCADACCACVLGLSLSQPCS